MEKKKTFRSRSGKRELGLWKEKYETLDEKYERMKTIIKQVFKDFKEETEKQQYLKKQYENLKKELSEKENLLERLQSDGWTDDKVSEAVVEEYSTLKTKYEMESEAATNAMKRATKKREKGVVTYIKDGDNIELRISYQKENQALKRQSAMPIQKVMTTGETINIDQLVTAEGEDKKEQDDEQESTEIDLLNQTVSKLRSEVIDLQMQLKKEKEQQNCLKEDIEIAKKLFEEEMMAHNAAKEKLKWMEQSVNQLKRVSELYVVQEFENLQHRYQKESDKVKRISAEIAVVQKENSVLSQQQAILLEHSTPDDQLAEALKKVEELTTELEDEICKHQLEVDGLKESLKEAKSEVLVINLKDKLQCMEQCLQQTEQRAYASERQVETLQQRVRELECQTQRLQAGLPPPPPPPPLPPPPAFNPIKSLMTLITAGKKVTAHVKKEKSDSHQQKAMTEMIETIKKGNVRLRPTPKGTAVDDDKSSDSASAVNEMMNILSSMKRKHHSPVTSPRSISPEEQPSELFEKLQRRKELSISPERISPKQEKSLAKEDDVDDELQRIFRKKSLTNIMTEVDELCQPTFSEHILDEIDNSTPDSLTEGETSGSTTDYNLEGKATPSPIQFVQLRRNRVTGEEMSYVEENLVVDSMQVNLEESKRSTFIVDSPREMQDEQQCSSQIKENCTYYDISINDQLSTNPESLNKVDTEIKKLQCDIELGSNEENITCEIQTNQDHPLPTEITISDHSEENIPETVKQNENNHYSVLGIQAGKNVDITSPLLEHENNLSVIHDLLDLTDLNESDNLISKESLLDNNESVPLVHNVDILEECPSTETEISVVPKKDEQGLSHKSHRDSETGIMLPERNSGSENLTNINKIDDKGAEICGQDTHDS